LATDQPHGGRGTPARISTSEAPKPHPQRALRLPTIALALAGIASAQTGTWTPVATNAPSSVGLLLLLSDGSVMAAGAGTSSTWFKLTPDATGSYVDGTWTQLASMHDTRLYYQTQVLRDGRVYVSGGEYGTGGPRAEVYDPTTNVWTYTSTPPAAMWNPASNDFHDCNSELLPDGRVLLMPVFPHAPGVGLIYDPASDSWSLPGPLAHGSYQDEASWVKLPDDSILTIDPFGVLSERYQPSTNTWVADSNVPVSLFDPYGHELGAAVLLADGRAFFLGSTGHTALYTPSGTSAPGTWNAGPDIPGSHGTPDAPAAMLATGCVLCAVSPLATSATHFPTPTTFYEYDPVANSFQPVNAPVGTGWSQPSYQSTFLTLPDGTVLHAHASHTLYVYQPSGVPLTAGRPVVTQITQNSDGSFHLVGTGLNGVSEGASYGDDWQMNTNYPLVSLSAGSNMSFALTYGWSSTGVQTGAQVVSTEFRLPANLPNGTYSLVVSASGITSLPVSFTVPFPVWTDLGNALPASSGVPNLTATGSLVADGSTNFQLAQCLGSTLGVCAFGTVAVNQPVFGGILVPDPVALVLFATSATGTANLTVLWNAGIPSGLSVFAQGWVLDGSGVQGFAATNAIQATAP
jgi:hypothetical protein